MTYWILVFVNLYGKPQPEAFPLSLTQEECMNIKSIMEDIDKDSELHSVYTCAKINIDSRDLK